MTVVINGDTGINSSGGYTGDGVAFADNTPANTLVTTTGGSVGIGTASPAQKLDVRGNMIAGTGTISTGISYDTQGIVGTFSNHALKFMANGTPYATLDTAGNLLITSPAGLGYGTGSGGTVTQATSKGTAVTLNKPTGQITMNNAALAANSVVSFTVNNSLVSGLDNVVVTIPNTGVNNPTSYRIWSGSSAGAFNIYLENRSAGSLSDALAVNFAIIKGATA